MGVRDSDFYSFEGLEAAVQDAHDDWRRGDFVASFEKYVAIVNGRLAIATESRLPAIAAFGAADIIVIERLADLARLFGYFHAPSDLLEAASLLCEESGKIYFADQLLLKRIDLFLGFGRREESLALLERMKPRIGDVNEISFDKAGLKIWETSCQWPDTKQRERSLIFALLYLVFGRILYGVGQYANAIASLRRGIAHTKQFHADISPHLELQLSLTLAAAYLDKGELQAADATLSALEPTVRSKSEPWPFVRWLELSAKLHQLRGSLSQAKDALTRVYNNCRRYKFHRAQLGAAMNFAHLLILMNQTVRAVEILEETKRVAELIGENTQAARSTFLMEVLRARMRSLVEAVPVAPSVSEMQSGSFEQQAHRAKSDHPIDIPQSDNYLATFEDRILEFHRYLGNSDIKRAAQLARMTRASFGLSDSNLIAARLNVVDATLSYYQGNVEEAEALFIKCAAALADLDLAPELWQAQRFLGWCWIRLGRPEEDIRELTSQTQQLLKEISDELASEDQVFFLLNKWTTEEEFIAGQVNRLSDMKKELASLPFYSRWRRRLRLMKELDAICLDLEDYQSKQAQRMVQGDEEQQETIKRRSFWRRLWRHSRKRLSIQFLVLPDRLLIIQRGWLQLDFGVSSATRIHLRELIQSWHRLVQLRLSQGGQRNLIPAEGAAPGRAEYSGDGDISQRCKDIAGQVADILQLPLLMEKVPKRVKALTFVPDDVLHGLPFAALRFNGSYLVERFAISASVGEQKRPTSRTALDDKRALLINVARGSRVNRIRALPGTGIETKSIGQRLSHKGFEVATLSDDTATKAAVLDNLPNCSIFHIACHGKFVRNRADLSGLLLLPSPDTVELLSFVDLSKLDLTKVQHATLSSCWSADNFVLPGRWIISLPESLGRAGVHSVLASFWEVEDQVAVSFMDRFFEYLSKHQRDEALSLTQLDCLHNHLNNGRDPFPPAIDTGDPFYWANFVLHGECKKLKLLR